MCVCMYVCAYVCMYVCVCTRARAHTHTHTHTYRAPIFPRLTCARCPVFLGVCTRAMHACSRLGTGSMCVSRVHQCSPAVMCAWHRPAVLCPCLSPRVAHACVIWCASLLSGRGHVCGRAPCAPCFPCTRGGAHPAFPAHAQVPAHAPARAPRRPARPVAALCVV